VTLPDKLTAAEFERLKAQEQRMLNSGSWVAQSENVYAAELNAKAAEDSAPATMTAEQADVAEAQQSVMAETSFGRSVGARPDYSSGPTVNPADSEPKTIEELRRKQQELYHDPTYDMPFEEWKDFTQWQRETEGEVTGFIRGLAGAPAMLGQLGVGIVKERAQQVMRATAGRDPIGAATAEAATFTEMGRKIGVGLTQFTDWAGGKINDMVASGRRVGQVQKNVVQALRDSGKLTGDPIQDNTTIQQALEEAAAQGMFEPTQQQAEEDDEAGYQRYQRNQAYTRDYMGVTQYSIGGNPMTLPDVKKTATNPVTGQVEQPMESTATVGAMALSPENFIPVGVGAMAKVRMLRRFASVTGKAFKLGEEGAAALDGMMMRGADRLTSRLPLVGDLSLNKRMAALGGVGAAAAYLDSQTDSPVVDVIAKPLIVAGAFLPAVKAGGATLRKVGSASGATWQIIREMDAGAMGTARAETAARMADSGKFNPRYARYMRGGAEGGVESTLRRVSQNADMPETLRKVARSADNIGITQLARGVDDVVSPAVVAGLVATPFALVAPDSETAGGIVGGAVLLGGTTGAAGRVIGRRSSRTDADIARMMVDVEMAGGDAGSLGALSYSGLDMLSAMQGITSGKVDFIPLRAQEYRANTDVKANGGETTAGLHIEQAADGRAKVYVNMGHTAPAAGRVSIRSVENGNVVRIKGQNGESDFTFVPKEYPLLVKSGDFVEPNAHLARGLSPTRIMPHEIGHAILTSNILNGTVRDDLRNLVNQRYDTPGVELRGREYVTRLVDRDIMAGAHDQLPDKLTRQEFDDIASGRKTLADILKGKPVSDAQRAQMIGDRYQEMRERSIAQGDNPDGLDVFRDEIVAETFSSLSEGIDFRRMRTGGPQVMESVLAATTRMFETLGMAFNPSTGKPLDNPSVIFRDNPLMQDPVMRKRMQEHLRNYEAWMLGMEQAGTREQKGTQVSVDGTAESARRSTHTKLRANENGILENDLIYIDQNGTAQWKSQGVLDQQERGRSAQVGQLYDKNKIVAPNSAEFGLRRTGGGRTIISGPTLPAKFDVLRWFPKHVREMARMLEGSRDRGASHIFDYNTIGTGEGGRYRVINRGDVQAILREGAFLGWEATKAGHLKAVIMDLNAFRSSAMKAINKGELGVFNNDMAQVHADLMTYLSNHKNGLPGEAIIGQQKRDMLNGLIGTGTAVQRDINPLYADLNPRGSVRTFRVDRVNDITPTGRDGYHFDYDKIKNNRMPQQIPREAQGMPDVAASGRGDGMPDGDYMAAVQRGDENAARKIMEDAIKPSLFFEHVTKGRVRPFWHHKRTAEDFTTFRTPAWFSKNKEYVQELKGPINYKPSDLEASRPYFLTPDIIDKGSFKDHRVLSIDGVDLARTAWKGKTWEEKLPFIELPDRDQVYPFHDWQYGEGVLEQPGVMDAIKEQGYQIIHIKERGFDTYAVLDPSIIKPADAVLRDEAGNVLPPSQRFGKPSAAPRAQAMPDSLESAPTDQLQRQYEENQGYLGLSTLGMREGRPVRGGAAQTRELLRRNEAISAELERRGVRSEDPQLQRALQRRGQAMPDVSDGLPRRNMQSRGKTEISDDGTITYNGKEPADWTPEDFAAFGKEFGVRNLGPLTKVVKIVDELGRDIATIPGGLDGEFTYYDLLWLKANPVDVKSLPVELHGKLTAKLARTMTPEPGNKVQKFNGIVFGFLSANAPLLPNEMGQSRLRFGSMKEIADFGNLLPDNPTQEQLAAVNARLKKQLGFSAAEEGGMGIGLSQDLSNVVMAAKMFTKNPDFFVKRADESWGAFVDKVSTQLKGLGSKTASFGSVWQDPLMASISAMDRHMSRVFSQELLTNPAVRQRFEGLVVKRFNSGLEAAQKAAKDYDGKIKRAKNEQARAKLITEKEKELAKLPDPLAVRAKTLDDVLGQAAIFGEQRVRDFVNEAVFSAMGTRKGKYMTAKGEVNPNVPESIQGVEWVETPQEFQVMSDAYRAALELNEARAKDIGVEIFPAQWTLWDRIRQRVEPHEAMFPGLEKLPALNDRQLGAAFSANKAAGYMTTPEQGKAWRRQSGISPSSLAYFTPAVLAAGAALSQEEQ
jgi:hypothetical protein